MNRFYHKEDILFDNISEAKEFATLFIDKTISSIDTENTFEEFLNRYEFAREQGNDILTSLEYAKDTDEDEEYLYSHWLFTGGNNE